MERLWIGAKEALIQDPDFFEKRGENSWKIIPEEYCIKSRFGFVEIRVQIKLDGSLNFDRAIVSEAPNINAVVWGEKDGKVYIGCVMQDRPFADNPDGSPAKPSIVFCQPCVMGFMEKADRILDEAAKREIEEESVKHDVIIETKFMGEHNPNPTFCASWSKLFEKKVDFDKQSELEIDLRLKNMPPEKNIYRFEFIELKELLGRIAQGEFNNINYRSATANDALLVFLSRHPEIWAKIAS